MHTGDRKESLVEKHRLHLEGQREAEGGEKSFRDHFGGEMLEGIWMVGRVSTRGESRVF